MTRIALLLAVAAAGGTLGAACPPPGPVSENGSYGLEGHGLATRLGFMPDVWMGAPVLVGERTCPTLACRQDGCGERIPADGGIDACVEQTVTGATRIDACVTFDTPGSVVWQVVPVACQPEPDAGVPLEADRFLFQALAAGEVVAEQRASLEETAGGLLDGGVISVEPAPPTGFGAARPELRIVEGGQAPVTAMLRAVDDGRLVAVEGDSLVLEQVTPTPQSVRVLDQWFLEADPGASARLRLATGTTSFDVATVEGVPLADAVSMELIAFYWGAPSALGERAPLAVHALVRDATGRVLDGAPVEWTLVQGDLATNSLTVELVGQSDDEDPVRRGPWVAVWDGCRPPSWRAGTTSALLRARLGALTEDVRLTWTLPPNLDGTQGDWMGTPSTLPADDEGFTRDPMCPPFPACGCASTRPGAGASLPVAAGLLATLLAVMSCATHVRRRRRGPTATPSAPSRKPLQSQADRAGPTTPPTPT